MSEIIASVYAAMERTGKKNGILFIDEINCVSETRLGHCGRGQSAGVQQERAGV